MNFEEAKTLLTSSSRWELRDHAFGDCELWWTDAQNKEIASGYSGSSKCDVCIYNLDGKDSFSFIGDEARELKKCGTLASIERNDETGPDTYTEGYIMPGLTKEAVLEEITTKPKGMS